MDHLLAGGTPVLNATTSGLRHSLAIGAAFAAAAAVLAWATKNTHENPAHHAAETDDDQSQIVAGLATIQEI